MHKRRAQRKVLGLTIAITSAATLSGLGVTAQAAPTPVPAPVFAKLDATVKAPACGAIGASSTVGSAMVAAGCEKKGTAYLLGGGHGGTLPAAAAGKLDCSGLARYAYWRATGRDVMDTTAQKQWSANPGGGASVSWSGLKPGDLAFFDWATAPSSSGIDHVAIYLGTSSGAKWFVDAVQPTVGVHAYDSSHYVAGRHYGGDHAGSGISDWNGDGRADILTTDTSGKLWYYQHTAGNTVSTQAEIGNWFNAFNRVWSADWNGDGRADILTTDSSGNLWYYQHTAGNTVSTQVKIGNWFNAFNRVF